MLKKNDVIEQLGWLFCNYIRYPLIQDMNYPEVTSQFVGQVPERLNPRNYEYYFEQMYCESKYSIVMQDDALIFFEYRFDEKDNLIQHNLSYIPTPYKFTSESDELPDESIQYEYLNRYLRIDFDSLGYTELTHTYVHMHMGIFEHSTRLPVSHTISPLEFLSLIFTHYYAEPISFPKVVGVDCPHIVRLSANEDAHFKFSFGNETETLQK